MEGIFYKLNDIAKENAQSVVNKAVECAEKYGFSGDQWANYLAYRLLMSENAFSLACEKGEGKGTVRDIAFSTPRKYFRSLQRITVFTRAKNFRFCAPIRQDTSETICVPSALCALQKRRWR